MSKNVSLSRPHPHSLILTLNTLGAVFILFLFFFYQSEKKSKCLISNSFSKLTHRLELFDDIERYWFEFSIHKNFENFWHHAFKVSNSLRFATSWFLYNKIEIIDSFIKNQKQSFKSIFTLIKTIYIRKIMKVKIDCNDYFWVSIK